MSLKSLQKRDHRNEPMYWFGILEIARERNDFEHAAEAKRQLERLGVKVTYRRNRQGVSR